MMQEEKGKSGKRKFKCRFCSFECADKIPELCPVCGASKEDFEEIHKRS